jgi:hypothetical protein
MGLDVPTFSFRQGCKNPKAQMGGNRLGNFDPPLGDGRSFRELNSPYNFSYHKIEGSLDLLFKTF